MKKSINTTFSEFLKTRKLRKIVDVVEDYFWQLTIILNNKHELYLTTLKPESDDYSGEHTFDEILEWFMCSDNPYFKSKFKNGMRIYVRDKIHGIELTRISKERVDGES